MTVIATTALAAGCAGRDPAVGYTYECQQSAAGRKILARVHALEARDGQDVVLVSIADGPNPGRAPRIVFAAFERAAFARSCPARSTKAVLRPEPRFNDTYRQWQADAPEGKAGVYSQSVGEVVDSFRTLPVPPFTADAGAQPAAALLGPGPNAASYFVEPQP